MRSKFNTFTEGYERGDVNMNVAVLRITFKPLHPGTSNLKLRERVTEFTNVVIIVDNLCPVAVHFVLCLHH